LVAQAFRDQRLEHLDDRRRGEDVVADRYQLAVDPLERRAHRFQVQVRRLVLHQPAEQ